MENEDLKLFDKNPLRVFAFLPGYYFQLRFLATKLAEEENWKYEDISIPDYLTEEEKKIRKDYGVLYQYIAHTFAKVQEEGKIVISEDGLHSIINTGLLTKKLEEIYMLFKKNDKPEFEPWVLEGFYRKSALEIPESLRGNLPDHIDYFVNCPEEAYFNTKLPVVPNIEHIIQENFDRLPESLRMIGDETQIIQIVYALIEQTKKRILRNNRLVVPNYYNKKIMYLAPLFFGKETFVLAIEKNDSTYRANTIFTLGMAYCNARLIAKPESNWLMLK